MSKISIIVPVYNSQRYLHKCIGSVLSQTFSDFELLLINDGSSDSSGEICNDFKQQDSRVRVFHKKNGGVSSARNIGLDEAAGEWICFVDSDDWIENRCLEILYDEVVNNHLDCLQFSFKHVDEQENIIRIEEYQTPVMELIDYVKSNLFCYRAGGSIIRKDIIDKYKLRFVEELKLGEDQLFILAVMANCKKMKRTNTTFYCYLTNDNSATRNIHFSDLCNTIKYFNSFVYRELFQKHVECMILSHTLLALRLSSCRINELYEMLKTVDLSMSANSFFYYKKIWLLRLSWKHGLLQTLYFLRFQYFFRGLNINEH